MKALATHNSVIDPGHNNHVCSHQYCSSAFGYKKFLERHVAKIRSTKSDQSATDPSESDRAISTYTDTNCPDNETADLAAHLSINRITGHAYSLHIRIPMSKTIWCPMSLPQRRGPTVIASENSAF
ncbi:hypothetical protein BDR07DRAFT_144202 [Suillus spraguei]|nr:hypothetical protein BDR07DRAFT_144202 [Suillus spraguei]